MAEDRKKTPEPPAQGQNKRPAMSNEETVQRALRGLERYYDELEEMASLPRLFKEGDGIEEVVDDDAAVGLPEPTRKSGEAREVVYTECSGHGGGVEEETGRAISCTNEKTQRSESGSVTPGAMSFLKYGLAVLPQPDVAFESQIQLDTCTQMFVGKLSDVVEAEQIGHWREAWGTLWWPRLQSKHLLVLTKEPTDRPNVSDAQNNSLAERLYMSWRALALCGARSGAWGSAWVLTGACGPDGVLLAPQTTVRLDNFVRPFYASQESFWTKSMKAPAEPWAQRLVDLDQHLRRCVEEKRFPDILGIGVKAFVTGYARDDLEFRIPDFVRAAEAILAVPRGAGGSLFAERALKLAPHLKTDWFAGGPDVHQKLVELYIHRSDCVHGKVPFLKLKGRGEAGALEAARLEYLAEAAARAALQHAILNPLKHEHFADRDVLESAWVAGRFP